MKICEIQTKDSQKIELGKLTLLVGANNVGKSQTLKDIHNKLLEGHSYKTMLVKDIKVSRPKDFEEFYAGLNIQKTDNGYSSINGFVYNQNYSSYMNINLDYLKEQFLQDEGLDYTFESFSRYRVLYMDAETRLQAASESDNYIPSVSVPVNLIQAFYGADERFDEKLQDAFYSTFGESIKLDYSSGLKIRFVVGEFDCISLDPRDSYPILMKYPSLEAQGDGYRSFVAVVMSLLLSKNKVVLLDEPEAFLHPEQARKLGKWISDHASEFPCQVVMSTHNASFLAGILAGKELVEIYRLNRHENVTKYHKITTDQTLQLSQSPILSSQRVLEGIFSKGVVVCESDTDRVIYNTVAVKEHENQEVLFIHAHNKQTIKDVVRLLKKAAIPVVAITDIDILNSEADFSNLLQAFDDTRDITKFLSIREKLSTHIANETESKQLNDIKHSLQDLIKQLNAGSHTLSGARGALNRIKKDSSKWSSLKEQGIDFLSDNFLLQNDINELIKDCCKWGVFIVPVGELEGWIKLDVKKNKWVLPALSEISSGKCPEELSKFVNLVINAFSS